MELEPLAPESETQQEVLPAEMLAVENLRAFLHVIASTETPLDPDVTQSVEAARRALGVGGRISVVFAGDTTREHVVIDEQRVEDLAGRKPRREELVAQVAGQLTMVDIEPPFRVAIRAASGLKWNCRYPPELEERVTSLLKRQVTARGTGVRVTAKRGYFEIESLDEMAEFEQTPLFSIERRPLDAILQEQESTRPQGWAAFADPEWREDEESEAYLRSLLGEA